MSLRRPDRITLAIAAMASFAAFAGCAVIASHEEYGAYRAVRRAPSERERLIAAQQYVESHPGGFWIGEVQEERRSHEDRVWEASNDSREGLEWYLRIYPDGQYVEQARPRLAALQTVNTGRQQEVARQEELEAERRRQEAEQRRQFISQKVQFWSTTLVSLRYGQPMQAVVGASPEFGQAFGEEPAPDCNAQRCIKRYRVVYHIPVPGATRIDRNLDLYLRLRFARGRLERSELVLPNKGFSRWHEMENRAVVTDEDPEQRNAAINWALERIQPLIEQAAQGAQRIDFIPEPLEPMAAVRLPHPLVSAKQDGDIDDLLGGPAGGQPPQQPVTPPEPQPGGQLVLPIGLLAWQRANVRIVVFAAGADDYDHGYDGFFVERVQ